MVVAGGLLLFRLIQPEYQEEAGPPVGTENEQAGRGNPTVPPSSQARRAGHETLDLSGRTLAILTGGLGLVVAVVIGAMILLQDFFVSNIEAGTSHLTAEQKTPVVPPLPHLQATPQQALATLHERENALLDRYGFVDPQYTRARIPIDRAMKLIVGHKLDTAP